ncbi:hypothetical protein [Magnetospirillum molischianum]|uniref:Uncharacterized protein n=1 Tax=Magnetospirillum molischianum DSM 120 TaxID=1150626 RepID=H8FNY3_MAGML|nr:hypothetical protein [Magnetospirillum molischianum]CCG40071.1 conserved exported hypothetical protein [Magnetospirillum molischianum DSM 120]
MFRALPGFLFVLPLLLLSFSMAALAGDSPRPGDTVPARLEAARAAHARGDLARAAVELEAAIVDLHARVGAALAECLPPPPSGWTAEQPETQGLFNAGGGLSVSRAYAREDASFNALLILDSPAVVAAAAQFHPATALPTNVRRLHLGQEEALLRWDSATRSGEITLVLGSRVLLQIEGDGIASGEQLVEVAKGWNLASIRKLVGV